MERRRHVVSGGKSAGTERGLEGPRGDHTITLRIGNSQNCRRVIGSSAGVTTNINLH